MPNPSPFLFGTLSGFNGTAGQCVIYTGAGWVLYTPTNVSNNTGAQIGVLLDSANAGGSAPIQISGHIDPQIFNLGPGLASAVFPGNRPVRGSGTLSMGSCDVNGIITVTPSYVGVGFGQAVAAASSFAVPRFVTDLVGSLPGAARLSVTVDGFSSVADGGDGTFNWDASYSGPSNNINIIPAGLLSGAWRRVIGSDNVVKASWFGARGDAHIVAGNTPAGTDDTAALQAMLDYNCNIGPKAQATALKSQYACKLNNTPFKLNDGLSAERTAYRLTSPIQKNDIYLASGSNTTEHFCGEPGAKSGLMVLDYMGPAVVDGNAGINRPFIVLDPSGSGEHLWQFGYDRTTAGLTDTTIAVASDGRVLPQSTINVVSTAGWPTAGGFLISDIGVAIIYTGKTPTSFTGCTVMYELFVGASTATMHTGQLVYMYQCPRWTFSDTSCGDLTGVTNFTLEFFVNPCDSTAYAISKHPVDGFISCLFACGGSLDSDTLHDTMSLIHTNVSASAGVTYLQFSLTTVNGSFVVRTSLTTDQTWTPNALNHVAVSYDGAHLRMFLNGTQTAAAGAIMTVAATGALDQKWYETVGWAQGARPGWPFTGGADLFDCMATVLLGRWRFSTIAIYTAPFTPPAPSALVCQATSRMFAEPLTSTPTRESLRSFLVGTCGLNVHGRANVPVWLRSCLMGPSYVNNSHVESMYFVGQGTGIYANASLGAEFGKGCSFVGMENGIILDAFSYNSGVGAHCTFSDSNGSGGNRFLASEIVFLSGSQFAYVKEGFSSSAGASNFGVVLANADMTILSNFPNSYKQGVYALLKNAFVGVFIGAVALDDQSAGYAVAGTIFAPETLGGRLSVKGGYVGLSSLGSPAFRIGSKDAAIEIDTQLFVGVGNTSPTVSFIGNNSNQSKMPVVLRGRPSAPIGVAIVDPAHPGPVVLMEQEAAGSFTITPAANADVTLAVDSSGDAFWREYELSAGAWSGGHSVVWPSNPRKIYEGKNNSGFTATLKCAGSSSPVSVSNGARWKVQDNGTDLVSLL